MDAKVTGNVGPIEHGDPSAGARKPWLMESESVHARTG